MSAEFQERPRKGRGKMPIITIIGRKGAAESVLASAEKFLSLTRKIVAK